MTLEKKQVTAKTIKRYDKLKTFYQQTLESPDVEASVKCALKEQFETLNPFRLRKAVDDKLKKILSLKNQ